ncbi:hypothetical protein SAMN02800692_0388 [Luteibacter sp. UNC138MFCol5.1]|uniref:hypothetical protein n=1 Tax=Luteibacter sp. UNC138MFCol5.1 TaxID=1502774 RepID=UPI0008C5C271|nr:hypothetical protein [Luteibacter sp. UNC138MFCol5.1]SEO35498.1 hypothetical protein SAMN02800692_0388 [Luteibacter sp. UNC138MFCol5.1]
MNDTLSPRRLRALIAMAWLAAGALLLLLTPLTGHSESLGWTPAFWLLLAPASILVAMKPGLPMSLLAALFLWERPRPRQLFAKRNRL